MNRRNWLKIAHILLGLPLAFLISACAAKPIPTAPSAVNVTVPTQAELTSSIRGTREKGLLGSSGSYVAGIDGKMIPQAPRVFETPIPIAAGVHSVLIGNSSDRFATLPARLDAKAGVQYVIRWERKTNIPLFPNTTNVWIEDEATGEIVIPKRQIWGTSTDRERYKEPSESGNTFATFLGSKKNDGLIGIDLAFLRAVDGQYSVVTKHDLYKPLRVKAGKRALVLGAYTGAMAEYPVVIDVQAGHIYSIGFVADSGVVPGITNERFTIWVEDQTTGVRVIPAQRVKLTRPHGQPVISLP